MTKDAYARFDELNAILAGPRRMPEARARGQRQAPGSEGLGRVPRQPIHEYRDLWDIDDRLPQLAWIWQLNRGVFKSPGSKWESWTTSIVHSDADVRRYVDNLEEFAATVTNPSA